MSLAYNKGTGAYWLQTGSAGSELEARALAAGLTLSTTAVGRVYFTHDPYAALPFWKHADESAKSPLATLRTDYERSWASEFSGQPFPTPPGKILAPFQAAGVDYCLSRRHALIGDQPGLGKTMQAIVVANATNAKRVLVVCPANVRLQWRARIREWSTIPRVGVYPILKSSDGVNPHANYVIISYELARSPVIHGVLAAMKWDLVVIDEAHYLKTIDAKRTQALFGGGLGAFKNNALTQNAERIVALTGTPLPNRPRECYTVVRSLCWDAIDWASEDAFKFKFNPSVQHIKIDQTTGQMTRFNEERTGRLPELQCRLRCNVMVRRLKRDVQKQLPEVQYELTYVEPDGAISRALRAESLLGIDPLKMSGLSMAIEGQVSTVRREMGEAMAARVVEHVSMLIDGGVDKVLLFAHHRSVIAELEKGLGKYGVVTIVGGVSPVRKNDLVQRFRTDPSVRVCLGNMVAMGTGTDGLQDVCDLAVFAEASWVPGDNEQCVDRLHRMGQTGSVLAQFMVAPGSFAERVLGTAIQKTQDIHATLDGK